MWRRLGRWLLQNVAPILVQEAAAEITKRKQ